jgi:phage tail sheath protein FI
MEMFSTVNRAPGVYIQEITLPGPIEGVATDITAFVGPAQSGPLRTPIPLTNINEFNKIFGSYIEVPYRVYAAHAVKGFFDESDGAAQCYFVRVGTGVQASLDLMDRSSAPQPTLTVTAQEEGVDGNNITVEVDDASLASTTAATATATVAGTSADQTSITVTDAAAAAQFKPGDVVLIWNGPINETATVRSVSDTTIAFQSKLANAYTSGTVRLDLMLNQMRIRVASTANFEPGSYVSISNENETVSETGVVRVVNPIANILTLGSGLTNTYPGSKPVTIKSMEFTLTVVSNSAGTEVFPNLAMDSRHSRYFGNIVSSKAIDLALKDPPSTTPPANNMPKTIIPATKLIGGVQDNLTTLTPTNYHQGIDSLKKVSDVRLLCVPDCVARGMSLTNTHDIQAYMIAHCEQMQDRFAILDSCAEMQPTTPTFDAVVGQRQALNSDNGYGALYFPWIGVSSPFGSGTIFVPPSGHVAGVYAKNDNSFGVYQAPANEPIRSALSLEVPVSDDEQGPLNEIGINVIRRFPNHGIRIWGARTIAPPDRTEWRYVNVRRLLLYIEKSIQEATRFAMFKPNNLALWQQIKRLVNDFLTGLWTEGALFGDTADKAFRVRVDESLNPPNITELGQLIVEVTVRPAGTVEFLIFQIIQDPTGATLIEATS